MDKPPVPVKPYFLRAFYDWIVDNGWTPLMLVDATLDGVEVPREHVKEGRVALNLTPRAIRDLVMENTLVSFRTRFSGVSYLVRIPMGAVTAIYAEENGQAITFPPETAGDRPPSESEPPDPKPPKDRGPKLRLIK